MHSRQRAVAGLVVALAMASSAPTRADDGDGDAAASLDETTFLQRVRERSPRVRALAERQRAAAAQVGVARLLPNPTLSYEREAVPSLNQSDDFVRLGFTLDVAGRRGLAVKAATAGAEAEQHDAAREQLVLEAAARAAYLDAVYARARMERLAAGRAGLATLVDTLQSRARQGDTSGYDADRAALELATLDDDVATARRALVQARLQLGAFVGEPATGYDASDALSLPAAPGTNEGQPVRPDVDAALARATQADRELVAARRRWVPRLELIAGVMASTQNIGTGIGTGVGYVVGIGGELPVFDRGGAAASRARADAKRWRAEAEAIAMSARAEVEQARRELALLVAQAEAYQAGPLARAADLERRAGTAYREGDRPILELLDVQRASRQVGLRALELIYEARRAELALACALGRTR